MIRHMRHGSSPRLMALQSILSPNRRESLPTPSAGVRMTASVGVEGRKQSMRRNGLLETDEARGGTLLLDQDSREDRACGVVQGHDKVEFRPLRQPRVLRAVLE